MVLATVMSMARSWRPRSSAVPVWALRAAGVAALAVGGVVAGRGVVAVSAERAGPSDRAGESHAVAGPAFTSAIRSWALTPAAAQAADTAPAPATTAYTMAAAETRPDSASASPLAGPDGGAPVAHLPGVALPASQDVVPPIAATTVVATPPVQVPAATRTPETAPAEPAAPVVAEPASPDLAVRDFYTLLEQGDFDQATALWSAHMRGAYPPAENIYGRFARTQALTVHRADVVALDPATGRATVAIDLTEVVGPPTATRRYVGTWQVVRGPSGWLLDQPNLQPS